MLARWVERVFVVVENATVIALIAFAVWHFWRVVPPGVHGAVFAGGSVLSAVLIALTMQLFGKFDKLLQDTEKYEIVRTERIYRKVGSVRHRLVWWQIAAVIALFITSGVAYLIKEKTFSDLTPLITIGYSALGVVGLAAARTISAYLRIDGFRVSLLRIMEGEDRRVQTLREMRRSSAVGQFSDNAPAHVGTMQGVG